MFESYKGKYIKLKEKFDNAVEMNAELNKEIKRLAGVISAKNDTCKVGVWCKDCGHVRYDKSEITIYDFDHMIQTCYVRNEEDGKIMYCAKYLHDFCPQHTKNKGDAKIDG